MSGGYRGNNVKRSSKSPNTIQVGRRTIPVTAVKLTADEGAEVFARYGMKHRRAAKYLLPRMLGFSVDGSEADLRAVGRHLPFIRFVPRP